MEFLDLWLSFMKISSLFCFGFRISSRLKSLCAHSFPFSSTHFAASVDFYILFFIIFFAIAVHCLICVAFVFVFLFWLFDYVAFFSLLSTFSSHFTFWEIVLPNSDNSIGCLNRIHINLMSTRPHAIRTEIWAAVLCVCVYWCEIRWCDSMLHVLLLCFVLFLFYIGALRVNYWQYFFALLPLPLICYWPLSLLSYNHDGIIHAHSHTLTWTVTDKRPISFHIIFNVVH